MEKSKRSPARPLVYQLREKMDYLMNDGVPLSVIGEHAAISNNRLKALTKIGQQSLDNAIHQGNPEHGIDPGDDRLGRDHQKKIGELFKFETRFPENRAGWPEWCDPTVDENTPNSKRRDTAENFRKRYRQEHGPPERDTTEQLMEGEFCSPQSAIDGLACVELTCGQIGKGQANIGVVISCDQAPVENLLSEVSVKRAVLEIACGTARARRSTIKGYGGQFETVCAYGAVRWTWGAGSSNRLRWRLTATGAKIGTIEINQSDLAVIEHLAHDVALIAAFGTWLKSINAIAPQAVSDQPVENIALLDSDGKEKDLTVEQLTVEQQLVMEHLQKRRLNSDDDNFAVLAKHELRVVRKR